MSWWRRTTDNLLTRTIAYYAIAGSVAWLLRDWTPTSWGALGAGEAATFIGGGARSAAAALDGQPVALPALVAMVTAFATALPVAWIYTLTRNKKGYQQSVVQTLIILPVTIAGIVVLVKHSVALAFSLGGIVAAVRFRTTLDDTKDAANIFVVTGIGMGAAVAPPAAWVLSVLYNIMAIGFWQTDFGRMPPALEGKRAEKSLERALAIANRTGMFVAKLDEEVLDQMAPEQLEALADRAWRRRKRAGDTLPDDAKPLAEYLLRVTTGDADAARPAAEAQFAGLFSRWKYMGKTKTPDGARVLEYSVAPLESVTVGVVKEILRAVPGGLVREVELRQ